MPLQWRHGVYGARMKKPGFTSSTFTGLSWTRRKFLTLGAGAIPLLTLSRKNQAEDFDYQGNPFRDRFQSFRRTFRVEPDREEAERIVRHIIRNREPRTDLIDLDVPDIAENGSAVPVVIQINCAMTEHDYPPLVHLLALENPFPEIAKYRFTPACGRARVTARIRMRTTAPLVVIAEMSDGSVGVMEKIVNVTLGACT